MSNCPLKTISTDTELLETFGNGSTKVGVLPAVPNGPSERDDTGKLLQSTISTIIANLKTITNTTTKRPIIPSASDTIADVFVQDQQVLIRNLQEEYCFYESRYKYALDALFASVSKGYSKGTPAQQAVINSDLSKTKMLNVRLNDLTQIMNGITENMLSTSDSIDNENKEFKNRIAVQKAKLDTQNKIIMKGDATTNIRKEMIKYTEEKAKYTDNLLNLYSFLNIVALGLLVYVYKAAGNE